MNYSGAGVVVIERSNFSNNKNAFYIVREKNGIWSIPGGKCDRDDNTYYTAHKELKEESRGLFSISPNILKTCYSYDKKAGSNVYYKAYFLYITSTTPIFRKYYYHNKKIIDINEVIFPYTYKETDKIDRIYIDTFINDIPNIQSDCSMITHRASNGEKIVLRGRDVSIIKHNIQQINNVKPYNFVTLQYNDNNNINGVNGFHTFYL
jgi:ADP-ribose pyrophosphatase YjhB (NUDIX family)